MSKWKYVVFAIVVFGYGCQKDDHTESPITNCNTPTLPPTTYFTEDRFQFKAPYYNPLNGNEICFFYKDNLEMRYALVKYNLATKETLDLVSEVRIVSKPVWSAKGWIAFDKLEDAQIWAVKENGDSLYPITDRIYNFHPSWDANGDHLYFRHTPTIGIPYYFIRFNFASSELDTLLQDGDNHNGYIRFSSIDISNIMVASTLFDDYHAVGLFNLDINMSQFVELVNMNISDWAGLTDLAIAPNGSKSYAAVINRGIFEIDNITGEINRLIESCWESGYEKISVSPDGCSLIAERIDQYPRLTPNGHPTGNIVQNSSIYIISLETLEEIEIHI